MICTYLGASSACLELENDCPYYAPESYRVFLDGKELFTSEANVFSLFDLSPDTDYHVAIRFASGAGEELSLHTKDETCCINIRSFGALGDGEHEDTAAIQAAINLAPDGARLYFPAGTYLTLPLSLRSHITLELAEGAVLLGSTQRERYPIVPGIAVDSRTGKEIPLAGFEGNEIPAYHSLLQASYCEDITIVGLGTVDGNAQNGDWWTHFREFPASRPRLFFFNRCRNVTVHGITAQNAASWQFHPYYSEHIGLYDIFIKAPKDSPNTDAIDPESCDYVDIIGCRFSVGDDCIAIKSGKIELGRKYKTPANHHTIRNCLMQFGHGAVTLGSEIGAGVQNLSVTQCYFRGTDRGLRIKTRRGRGKDCVLDQILFENIRMEGVLTPVAINMWYNCCDPDRFSEYVWSREHLPVDDRTPHLGKFTFRKLACTDVHVAACYIDGLPEMPIDEVVFQDSSFRYAENAKPGKPIMKNHGQEECRLGLYLDNVRRIRMENVTVEGADGAELIANHYEELDAPGLSHAGG